MISNNKGYPNLTPLCLVEEYPLVSDTTKVMIVVYKTKRYCMEIVPTLSLLSLSVNGSGDGVVGGIEGYLILGDAERDVFFSGNLSYIKGLAIHDIIKGYTYGLVGILPDGQNYLLYNVIVSGQKLSLSANGPCVIGLVLNSEPVGRADKKQSTVVIIHSVYVTLACYLKLNFIFT